MAKPITTPSRLVASLGKIKQTIISGSFAPNGSSAITQSTVKGWCTSVSRAAAGLFSVNLPAGLPAGSVLSVLAQYQASTSVQIAQTLEVCNVSDTAGTFQISSAALGTTTNTDLSAGRVNWQLVIANTGVTR